MQIADQLTFITEKSATPAEDTFETLARRRKSIIKSSSTQALCPLCAFDPAEDSEEFDESSSFKTLLNHIAGHLESIALLSLPEREESEDELSTNMEDVNMREKEDLPSPLFDDEVVADEELIQLEGYQKSFEDGGIIDGTDLQLKNDLMLEPLCEIKGQDVGVKEEDGEDQTTRKIASEDGLSRPSADTTSPPTPLLNQADAHSYAPKFDMIRSLPRQLIDAKVHITESEFLWNIPSARTDKPISEGSVSPTLSPSITPRRNSDLSSATHATSTNNSDLETLNSLRDQLVKAKVLINTARYDWIIPRCQLKEIITHQNVVSDISLNCPDLNNNQVHQYAEIVVEKAKSLYATLVLIKQSGSICRILDEQVFDADLPLTYCMPGKKRTNSFATTKGRFVISLETWSEESKEDFAGKQWSTLAKVFELGKHYELEQNHLLPFIRLEEWEYVEKRGAFGKVYSARIHPSHHEFKLNVSMNICCLSDTARLI
jgi:hypothetical protein